jgi:membrane protein
MLQVVFRLQHQDLFYRMPMNRAWKILKRSFWAWMNENALEWGAALAYYTVFSIAPLLIIALMIVGVFYKGDSLGYVHTQIMNLVGRNAADTLTSAVRSIRTSGHNTTAGVVSTVVLVVGASSVFAQLQAVLNRIWGVQPKPGRFWRDLIKQRLVSFAMVVGVGFVMLVSLVLSAVLTMMTDYFSYLLPGADVFWHSLDAAVSFSIIALLFAAIFKVVPDVHVGWRDVWLGGLISAALFVIGKTTLAFYLARSGIESAYGAAGSLLVLLAWVYYSSQILFFGAEFTKLHAEENRSRVRPVPGVEALSSQAKQRARGEKPARHDEREAS